VAVGGPELAAQPLMQALKQPGAVRASFTFYNTRGDADALVKAVKAVAAAGEELQAAGYELLHRARQEPWGQTVARMLSSEGLIFGISYAPALHG